MTQHQQPNNNSEPSGGGKLGAAASLIAIVTLIASALWALNIWSFSDSTTKGPVSLNEERLETTVVNDSPAQNQIS